MNFESPFLGSFPAATRGRVAKPLDCDIYDIEPVRKRASILQPTFCTSIRAILVNRLRTTVRRRTNMVHHRSKFHPFPRFTSK
jgi:hypothetical protein